MKPNNNNKLNYRLPGYRLSCDAVTWNDSLNIRSSHQWFNVCFLRQETLPHIFSLHPGV